MANHAPKKPKSPWGTRSHEQLKATGITPPKPTEAERKRAREADIAFYASWAPAMCGEGERR